jgi:hypothetical protein
MGSEADVKAFCYSVVVAVILVWTSFLFVAGVRVARARQHLDAAWVGRDSMLMVFLSTFGMLILFTSWVLAVYVWAKIPRSGPLHILPLVFLIPFGLFWSHFYILASARLLPTGRRETVVGSVA